MAVELNNGLLLYKSGGILKGSWKMCRIEKTTWIGRILVCGFCYHPSVYLSPSLSLSKRDRPLADFRGVKMQTKHSNQY